MPAFRQIFVREADAQPATTSNGTCTSRASTSSTRCPRAACTSRRSARASSSTRACSRPTSCRRFYPDLAGRARRDRARARALALLHEHVPELAARAPVPDARAQRRDQHRAGQRELDARPRRRDGRPTCCPATSTRAFPICTPGASDTARFDEALELLNLAGRPLHHAILMMIPEAWENHEAMDADAQGVLPLPRRADGAVGRPGVDRVHRRHRDRRGARPQRPAPVALLGHRRRPRDHGERGRRARRRPRARS